MANGPDQGTMVDTGSGLKYYPPVDTRHEAESAGVTRVRVATAAALPANTRTGNVLTADANAALNDTGIDGLTDLALGELVLVQDESTAANNGVYKIIHLGAAAAKWKLERAAGWDTSDEVKAGRLVAIAEGTANGDKLFQLTADDPITLNTTSLTFARTAITAADVPIVDADGQLTATELEAAMTEISTAALPNTAAVHYVRGASTANVAALATFTVANDGITFVEGERVLLKDQTSADENGIYVVGVVGGGTAPLTRATDFDNAANVRPGALVMVAEGTAGADTLWQLTTNATIVVGTTNLTFVDLVHGTAGAAAGAIADAGSIITATAIEGALQEVAGDLNTHRPGTPMQNRLRMLGAPGAIVEGDTVTIGGDVYEFRSSTPPAGGTAGRIWVYNGANSAASRANLIDAINNEGGASEVTYDGAVTEAMYALAGVTTGDIILLSATAIGSKVAAPSATATACSEVLTTATDIWDSATMEGGVVQAPKQLQVKTVTLAAAHVAKGDYQFVFDFTPVDAIVVNHMRPQDEAWVISGDSVSLTLAGGAGPNNQATDVVSCIAIG